MRTLLLLLCLALSTSAATRTIDLTPVAKWITSQREVRSIEADFIQTRAMRTLRDPLANPGKLWFQAPDSFRWELGNPAKTILLRQGGKVWLIQPLKKKATVLKTDALGKEAGMKGFAMMNFPMAGSLADFHRQFEVLDLQQGDGWCDLSVLPRDAMARKYLKTFNLRFNTTDGQIRYFEMITKEGSTLRNEFSNVRANEKIERAVFNYDFTGYEMQDGQE